MYNYINQALLVTGGSDGSDLSSTEIYTNGIWKIGAALPSPRNYLMAATVDNSVFVFGKNNSASDYF